MASNLHLAIEAVWQQVKPSIAYLQLHSQDDTLHISMECVQEINNMVCTMTKVCACHEAPLEVKQHCPVTLKKMDQNDVAEALFFGSKQLIVTRHKPGKFQGYQHARGTIMSRVPIASVSESMLFGIPLLLYATNTTKHESWEAYQQNQSQFLSLAKYLNEHDQGLIVASAMDWTCTMSACEPLKLQHVYLIIADAQGQSLLARRIATKDDMLPHNKRTNINTIDAILPEVQAAMDTVTCTDFNPYQWSSKFIDHTTAIVQQLKQQQPHASSSQLISNTTSSNTVTTTKQAKKNILIHKID